MERLLYQVNTSLHRNDCLFMGESWYIVGDPAPVLRERFAGITISDTIPRGKFGYFALDLGRDHERAADALAKVKAHYYGMIGYGVRRPRTNPGLIMIWKQAARVPPELYTPPVRVIDEKYKGKTFHIVREDFLIGGSKQRVVIPLLESRAFKRIKDVGYAGPVYGYAQIALAYGCRLLGKQAHVFVERRALHPFTAFAQYLGAEIHEVSMPGVRNTPLKKVQAYAAKYAEENKVTMLPFGLQDAMYEKMYVTHLGRAVEGMPQPRRIWLVAGSAVILGVLARIFPHTFFLVVQVGKRVWPDQLPEGRAKLFIAPERFWEPAAYPPPYPSVSSYDAKLWRFVTKHGEDGDFVWNVAKDI
jgi:hypothetical protein